ncbi:MAG: hypothetical protein ACRDZ3_03925 [Acidimicrobiia bacterium]
MRRHLIMLGLAALTATVLPLPAAAQGGDVPCSLVAVPAATAPVGTDGCPGVRPGTRLATNYGGLCTANFLFRAPDGTRYIGTAGHCIGPNEGGTGTPHERVWAPGRGPDATTPDGGKIGEFAYGALQSHGTGVGITYDKNFALIRLDPNIEASPEMCFFGGPSGLYATDTADPFVVHYYGSGDTIGDVLPARSGVAQGTPDPDRVYATGVALAGDGGSPVITADGLALGVVVTFSPHGVGFSTDPEGPPPAYLESQQGTLGITRLAPELARASVALGVPLELVTAD